MFEEYSKQREFKTQRQIHEGLTENELKMYGQRCPKGFKKLDLLGKGGAAIVYLCERSEGEFFAVK